MISAWQMSADRSARDGAGSKFQTAGADEDRGWHRLKHARPPRAVHSRGVAPRDLVAAGGSSRLVPRRPVAARRRNGFRRRTPLGLVCQEDQALRALRQLRLQRLDPVVRGDALRLACAARSRAWPPRLLTRPKNSARRVGPPCAPTLCNAWRVPRCHRALVPPRPRLAPALGRNGARARHAAPLSVFGAYATRRHNARWPAARPGGSPPSLADPGSDARLARRSGVCWGRKKKLPSVHRGGGSAGGATLLYPDHEAPASPLRFEEPAPAAHELAAADEAELELAGLLLSFASDRTWASQGARQRGARLARCVRRVCDPRSARGARARRAGASAHAARRVSRMAWTGRRVASRLGNAQRIAPPAARRRNGALLGTRRGAPGAPCAPRRARYAFQIVD